MNELANNILNNFYKFIFVFGILICAASLIIPEYLEFKLYERLISAEREINRIDAESSANSAASKLFEMEKSAFEVRLKQATDSGNLNLFSDIADDWKEKMIELQTHHYKIGEGIKNIKTDSKYLIYLNNKIESTRIYKNISIGFGVLLIILGLLGWYFRVQRLLDQKLKREISV